MGPTPSRQPPEQISPLAVGQLTTQSSFPQEEEEKAMMAWETGLGEDPGDLLHHATI